MKVITLPEDMVLDGRPRRKGEILVVPDDFDTSLIGHVVNVIPEPVVQEEAAADGPTESIS